MKQVLVTDGTGFLATRIISQLLTQGYAVRTTVRSLKRKEQIIKVLPDNQNVNGRFHL